MPQNSDASRSGPSGTAPDSPAACKFKKVLVDGLPPRKNAVDALMKSLEERGVLGPHQEEGHAERAVSRPAFEPAESRPQAVADSGALATILAFSSRRIMGTKK